MSDTIDIGIRMARATDADSIADIFVDSWQETYAGILPTTALSRMSRSDQKHQWTRTIHQSSLRSPVFVAADADANIYGFASAGPSRDLILPYDAEIYTLYIAPGFTGQGLGTALVQSVFRLFSKSSYRSVIIWALAENPSRFFYEAIGGKPVAERQHPVWGEAYREIAYGWSELNMHPRSRLSSQSNRN